MWPHLLTCSFDRSSSVAPAGRRSLIVFSDGEDQSSQASFAHVERALKGSDAALFAVGLGRGREQANLRETLAALAEPSGGRALFAERPAELAKVFAELRTELAHQYLVGYESTNANQCSWRKVSANPGLTSLALRARVLCACGAMFGDCDLVICDPITNSPHHQIPNQSRRP